MDEQEKKDFGVRLAKGISLLAAQKSAAAANREEAKRAYGKMLDAHLQTMAAIAGLLDRYNLTPGKTSESISHRLTLIASFVQGVDTSETAISEGLYIQAAALVRQELETIAALEEVNKGARTDGAVPNVKHVGWNLRQMYGELSKGAHVCDKGLLSKAYGADTEASDGREPTTLIPKFDSSVARGLYGLHVALMLQLAMHLGQLFDEMYGLSYEGIEYRFLEVSVQCLHDEGWLAPPPVV